MIRRSIALMGLMCLLAAGHVSAHDLTPDQLRTVRFDQRLGQPVPLDLTFHDDSGATVSFHDFFGPGNRPVVLTLNYFHCQNLCPLELDGLMYGLNGLSFAPGNEFNLLTVSIDPREGPGDAADAKARALRAYDRTAIGERGWHLLTGDQDTLDRLTSAVGFHDVYDPQEDEFAHPLGAVVLTPDGRISRYLLGIDFSANDLRLALVDASGGAIGSVLDRALLVCYHYDPLTGRYTSLALDLLHWGAGAAVLAVGGFLGWLWWNERRGGSRLPGGNV